MRHTSLDFVLTSFYFTTTGHVAVVIYHISISKSNQSINQSSSSSPLSYIIYQSINQPLSYTIYHISNQVNQSIKIKPKSLSYTSFINHIPIKTSQSSPPLLHINQFSSSNQPVVAAVAINQPYTNQNKSAVIAVAIYQSNHSIKSISHIKLSSLVYHLITKPTPLSSFFQSI